MRFLLREILLLGTASHKQSAMDGAGCDALVVVGILVGELEGQRSAAARAIGGC